MLDLAPGVGAGPHFPADRVTLPPAPAVGPHWSDQVPGPPEWLRLRLNPDGRVPLDLAAHDAFFPGEFGALPLAVTGPLDTPERIAFALEIPPDETFHGTGERFAGMDLRGRTIRLWNEDALGVNNRRAYKNVPFLLGSRGWGLFIHTSREVRLSIGDLSTRSLIVVVEGGDLDLFLLGGGSPERVLHNYRRLTGFPPRPPQWTFGTWMSRMTYFRENEVKEVCRGMREGGFPCDVIHLDTGWFAQDWVCEWTFSRERFPDPARFFADLRADGFRVSLWQNPNIGEGNRLRDEAIARGFLPAIEERADGAAASDFSDQGDVRQIDFTHPGAVAWYQEMLRELFRLGAAAIKTDFGEVIRMDARWHGLPAAALRNLYALLYQRAAFEETVRSTGNQIIWARAGWAGCQRYPIHWGGDAACSWDGMAGSLRGGLHLGLSGFAHWSHDVPGFHGVPDFMNSRPSDALTVRWTQFGVLSSHLRYHGTSAREPWEYPAVADLIRQWLRLRYALIPYLWRSAEECSRTGWPMLRAMLLEAPDDSVCRRLDLQYLLGPDLLVAPVFNDAGTADLYLPAGDWVDFWTGGIVTGPRWMGPRTWPLGRLPLFVRRNARIPVYPHPVAHTAEMHPGGEVDLIFDETWRGLPSSPLHWIEL